MRTRKINFKPGQEIYRRNFAVSDATKNINAKFLRKWLPCRVVRPVGQVYYEVEGKDGKKIGQFHVKDLTAVINIKNKD